MGCYIRQNSEQFFSSAAVHEEKRAKVSEDIEDRHRARPYPPLLPGLTPPPELMTLHRNRPVLLSHNKQQPLMT